MADPNIPAADLALADRIQRLDRLYRQYHASVEAFPVACREKCDHCCTCNVVVTSLEAAHLLSHLGKAQVADLKKRLAAAPPGPRFRPVMTTNGFARACIEGKQVPEEENDPAWGSCPLLSDNRCTVYHARPFGCRNMMSDTACADIGYARMDPLALTLNNLFLQCIEQLDRHGFSGNLTDVLTLYLEAWDKDGQRDGFPGYLSLENMKDFDRNELFVGNHPVPALMIPPAHRKATAAVLKKINGLWQV